MTWHALYAYWAALLFIGFLIAIPRLCREDYRIRLVPHPLPTTRRTGGGQQGHRPPPAFQALAEKGLFRERPNQTSPDLLERLQTFGLRDREHEDRSSGGSLHVEHGSREQASWVTEVASWMTEKTSRVTGASQ
jgi:hypothetical protein